MLWIYSLGLRCSFLLWSLNAHLQGVMSAIWCEAAADFCLCENAIIIFESKIDCELLLSFKQTLYRLTFHIISLVIFKNLAF